MTGSNVVFRAVPGPGFVTGCMLTTWLDDSDPYQSVAYVLIGHPPPRRVNETPESIESGLMGMVDAMRLRPGFEHVPWVGERLIARGPYVALDYGHPEYFMRLPVPDGYWRQHIEARGQACVTIGLDPMPPGAGPDQVEAYLRRVVATSRAYMGVTAVRN
ncbi:hypothetical protein ACFV97_07900 [Streptomyces sp. NPDC059913]|uniref:hypothetical protein n=1 Tax=unclassified Streptomyces TaxID=2593676 RepID=UPI0036528414